MHEQQFRIEFVDLTKDGTIDARDAVPIYIQGNPIIYVTYKDNTSGTNDTYFTYLNHYSSIGRIDFRTHLWDDRFVEISVTKGKSQRLLAWIEGWVPHNDVLDSVIQKIVQGIIVEKSCAKKRIKYYASLVLLDVHGKKSENKMLGKSEKVMVGIGKFI